MKYTFSSELRKDVGKNASNRIREKGYIPAIVYGSNINSLPLEIDSNQIENFIRNYSNGELVGLNVGGVNYTVFLKEIQKDSVTGKIIHVDFQQVSENEKINVSIPIILRGKSLVEKRGSIVQQQLRDIGVECFADNIPKAFEVDISLFELGDTLKVADMEFGEEITTFQDPQSIIASVTFAQENKEVENKEE